MGIKTLAYFVILCSILLQHGIRGVQFSKQEELQWNKEFKLLKKPSVKTIKTKYGQIYDCVDFYKQPAFDHPLLKNHSSHPQIRPSFAPEWVNDRTFEQEDNKPTKSTMFEDGGCPLGTVPIRRLNKDEFFQMKQFAKDYASRSKPNIAQDPPESHFALVETTTDQEIQSEVVYNGVRCNFNIYGPTVRPPQYSSGVMIVRNNDDRIKVGWTVNPGLYKDNQTHLFQYLDAGESHCFNLLCPGFVQVDPDLPIDVIYPKVSVRGGAQWGFTASVILNTNEHNWWLEVGDGASPRHTVGYWPGEIFNQLGNYSATYIAVGGETHGPLDQPLPPMGNGYYPVEDAKKSAFCGLFAVLDGNGKQINPQSTDKSADDSYGVYDVADYAKLGRTVFFGGILNDSKGM